MNLVVETKVWLANNHIVVPDDWLQACVEWIQEENQGRSLSKDELNSLVYEQWLLSDLHELEVQCLPRDITTASKYELTGTYALQIDSILDVGLSFYSQQQKVKGTENANAKVSADEPTYKPWEQKPSRMLMIKLTDGKQVIQGMEYKQITCLNPQTLPGTKSLVFRSKHWNAKDKNKMELKYVILHGSDRYYQNKVLVHGSILCRYGVLMLSEANIKNLGGEVDTLVEANSVLNTLQSAMEASAELANKNHRQEFRGSEIRNNKTDIKQSQITATQGRTFGQGQGNVRAPINPRPSVKHEPQSQRSQGVSAVQQSNRSNLSNQVNAQAGSFHDDFIDDIDFDDDFEEACMQSYNRSSGSRNAQQQTGTSRSINNPRTSQNDRSMQRTSQLTSQGQTGQQRHSRQETIPRVSNMVNQPPASQMNTSNNSMDDFDDDDDDFDIQAIEMAEMSQSNSAASMSRSKHGSSTGQTGNIPGKNHTVHMDGGIRNTLSSRCSVTYKDKNIGRACQSNETVERVPNQLNHSNSSCELVNSPVSNNTTKSTVSVPPAVKTENTADSSENMLKRGAAASGTQSSSMEQMLPSKIQKIKTEQKNLLKTQAKLDVEGEYPYTYLSKVMDAPIEDKPTYHTVKAYISTLTGKLSSQNNKWTLSCKINDGTQAVDVDLSTQVLTEMIGFSPQEAQEMKKRVSREPQIKEVLKQGLQQCQQKLIELMCLMEIEMSTKNPRPVIVATRQLTTHNAEMLCNRVLSNWDKF